MEVHCEGCAGCCIDWRPLVDREIDHERRGPREPLDDVHNLVPLTRDEVRAFLDAGLGDVMTPRLWRAGEDDADHAATVDGVHLAGVDGRPAFFVGLRKPPKPVAPFDRDDPAWLPTCTFLDPTTLQCRVHGEDVYPQECAEYPGHNLELGAETECERVEAEWGGERLVDDDAPAGLSGLLLGPQALGQKLFVHPDPDRLAGAVERLLAGEFADADRAEFVAAAAASSPGTTAVSDGRFAAAREQVLAADSWAGRAVEEWMRRAGDAGASAPDATLAERVEDERGAPGTPGWD